MITSYNVYVAEGYNKSGEFLSSHKSFPELKKWLLKNGYKRTMVMDGNFILFTGMEIEDLVRINETNKSMGFKNVSLTLKKLRDDFRFNFVNGFSYA